MSHWTTERIAQAKQRNFGESVTLTAAQFDELLGMVSPNAPVSERIIFEQKRKLDEISLSREELLERAAGMLASMESDLLFAQGEIERLRAALQAIAKPALGGKLQQQIAQRALEGK